MKAVSCAKKSRDKIPASVKRKLLQKSNFSCSICGKIPIVFHHIEEWAKNYSNDYKALIPICDVCYDEKRIVLWIANFKKACIEMGIKDLKLNDDLIMQFITNPNSFWKYYLDTELLIFYRRAMRTTGYGKKSNPGGADLEQVIYLGWADIFVIQDNNFYKFMKELKDINNYQKEIFTFEEFREYLGISN